jgi:hypothetical protein
LKNDSYSGTVATAGCVYTITITAKNSKTGKSATQTLIVNTVAASTPTTTVFLTLNGSSNDQTLTVGDNVNWAWSSTNADSVSSTYTSNNTNCGAGGNWGASTLKGSFPTSKITTAGCNWVVTITAKNSKTGKSATKTMKVNSVAATTTVSFDTQLKRGDEGKQVSALQSALKQIGLYSGEITGFFGDLTKKSVMSFQKANALDAVGEVGPKTRELLNSILGR